MQVKGFSEAKTYEEPLTATLPACGRSAPRPAGRRS
jgi:hypothetical protein